MMLRTDPKTLVLAALADGPRHGYALAKSIRGTLGDRQPMGYGQVYVTLRGLEAAGWVIADSHDDGAERRVYHLTETGRSELGWRTAEWHACADAIARMLPHPDRMAHP